jgi:hypothetical protein
MHDSRKVYLFLVLCLLFGLLVCAGCSQKAGPGAIVTDGQTVSIPVSPGQPDPGTTGGTCPVASQIWCNGRCIDPATDMGNCGGCMNPCQPGQPCINGKCGSENPGMPGTPGIPEIPGTPAIPGTPGTPATPGTSGSPSCTSGQTNCYGSCVDLQSDATHCGTCNTKCASGKVCSAGSCTISCSAGQNNCGGSCINTQTSSQHCGKCNNPCSSGQTCQNGKCGLYAGVMTLNPQDLCVGSGKLWCSGACISQDVSNCGTCGHACSSGQTCQNGKCGLYAGVVTLDPQQVMCTSSGKLWCSGACINQGASNCGSCGHACKSGEACSQGTCLSWTGSWNVKAPGPNSPFKMVQTGTSVTFILIFGTPTYTHSGTTAGNPPVLAGTWIDNLGQTGTFEYTMSADGKQFTGWSLYTGSPKIFITGTRT